MGELTSGSESAKYRREIRDALLDKPDRNMREDLFYTYNGAASLLGWTVDKKGDSRHEVNGKLREYKYGNKTHLACTGNSHVYSKGNKKVWFTGLGWACAEVDSENCYTGHRYYATLKEAFETES